MSSYSSPGPNTISLSGVPISVWRVTSQGPVEFVTFIVNWTVSLVWYSNASVVIETERSVIKIGISSMQDSPFPDASASMMKGGVPTILISRIGIEVFPVKLSLSSVKLIQPVPFRIESPVLVMRGPDIPNASRSSSGMKSSHGIPTEKLSVPFETAVPLRLVT